MTYDRVVDDELQRAVVEAYVYVAAADGDLAALELERFVRWAREQEAFEGSEPSELAARFGDVAQGFRDDFDAAEERALAAVAAAKDRPGGADLVESAAGVAVVADEALQEVEETAVDRVRAALGRGPSNR